jgi:hypothetical protein
MASAFFGDDAKLGCAFAQDFDNRFFGFAVGLGYQVVAHFFIDDQLGPVMGVRL